MSATPRTDAARHNENDPYMAIASECSKLERELNAANQRIKRLEEAGDEAIHNAAHGREDDALEIWRKAMEKKP